MAVSKAEITKTLTVDQQKEIKSLESYFDMKLRENYSGHEITINLDVWPHERVQKELKRLYQQAGWKIKFESHQRDGDFVRIS